MLYAGANQSWFHLYEVVQPPAADTLVDAGDAAAVEDALSAAGTTLEQFMQTATLGEYAARLALLASFHRHASVQVDLRKVPQEPIGFMAPPWRSSCTLPPGLLASFHLHAPVQVHVAMSSKDMTICGWPPSFYCRTLKMHCLQRLSSLYHIR